MENSSAIIYYRDINWDYLPISNKYWYLNVVSTPLPLAVSRGIMDGYSVFTKSGYNGAVTGAEEDIWSVWGVFVQPTAGMQMEVASSSASDTSAWTWAQSIRIFYLDNTFTEKSTDVTMNWVTPVATTATDIYRINGVKVITMWSNWAAVGDIDVRHLSNTPIYSRIDAEHARDRCFIYTVPKWKALYITSLLVWCWSQTVNHNPEHWTPSVVSDHWCIYHAVVGCYSVLLRPLGWDPV